MLNIYSFKYLIHFSEKLLHTLNQQYPQIGVQISQETEFDHRSPREIDSNGIKEPVIDKLFHRGRHTPSYSTTTNSSGTWRIEDVVPGTYNVVAEKDSFGNNINSNYIIENEVIQI